jgi:hypothetical protein
MLITRRIGIAGLPDHVQPRTWCIVFKSIVIAKQDAAPLFFGSLNWQNSRIPAGIERSLAVNFLQKQQKQRDLLSQTAWRLMQSATGCGNLAIC